MAVLLPTHQVEDLQAGLIDYLSTTFALTDRDARAGFQAFLEDPSDGIFKGPFVRLRLPFEPASDGWRKFLDWYEGFAPYGHQAHAFERLTSKPAAGAPSTFRRPAPTLVTTGTGSGKTESFLYPILDHVLRAKAAGITGMKALILYPMNALANDQAQRLASMLIENPELGGISAGIYTGQRGAQKRTTVSAAGLINSREIFRSEAPDILLTNYKMLDMLLLREDDAPIWQQSATSLQYVVLDEFHTYDGAQGTDVAMLLRRLGLTLKSNWPADLSTVPFGPTEEDRARPLGRIAPVATSATLGAKDESEPMLRFAETVFGEAFPDDAVVTESRLSIASWAGPEHPGASEELARVAAGLEETTKLIEAALFAGAEDPNAVIVEHVSRLLFGGQPQNLLEAVRTHPLTRAVLREASDAVALEVLAERVLGEFNATGGPRRRASLAERHTEFMAHFLALLSHVRAQHGREAVSVETHLWVRELSRIDKSVDAEHRYRWNDDGPHTDQTLHLPAIYCRHCGRSGWGAVLGPTGADLENDDSKIRREAATGNPRFRALIHAPNEDAHRAETGSAADGLRWLDTVNRTILAEPPAEDSPEAHEGRIVPVLMLLGQDADDQSKEEYCPACQTKDGIRFLGSAIATMLSVSISNLFGADGLDSGEKKALVFTDSVQDAAHRAGFVQARSHILTLRSAFRNALEIAAPGGGAATLQETVDAALANATTPVRKYQLIAPDYADRPQFKAYWDPQASAQERLRATRNAQKRVLFDASIEFGLQSRLGRTLELTGAIVAETDAGSPPAMLAAARTALEAMPGTLGFEGDLTDDGALVAWVRGVVERVRTQGGIRHKWLESYMAAAGARNQRWQIWGGRRRSEGMPAFPRGRSAPAFPRLGGGDPGEMDPIASTQSWYTRWTARCLKLPAADATYVAKALFGQLEEQGVLESVTAKDGATVFALPTDRILLQAPQGEDVGAGRHFLACSVCRAVTPGTRRVVDELDGAPCTYVRCPGRLVRQAEEDNFYRKLYATREPKRVVASEHTSLLPDEVRLKIEDQFKSSAQLPDAPNVLVATPTLEMGIDIGDLSCVMLASLPTSVSSYLQRVGRAGRLTGNSLVLAYARGRGEHLPKLHDPLSVINGEVRPPATFLDAEEILQRQYLAHLVDRFARDAGRPHPRKASAALGHDKPGSFLGDLIAAAHEHADEYQGEFLGQFGTSLSLASRDRLREWATPRDDGSSELAEHAVRAARLWAADCAELQARIDEIEKTLPELRAMAEHNGADEEAKRAPKSAEATQRMLRGQLFDLRGEYWISVLEKYGLLPNYTLLDDSVNFDIGVTTQDAESLEYHTETISLQRGAAIAINELAPGATFYSRGLEVKIDAVDLGPQQSHVQRWQVCPECGWANTDAANEGGLVKACGRCKLAGIADVSQQFDVVIMKKVSAEVRRDEAAIGDRNDQRVKERFNTVLAADIDPEHVTDEWFLEDFEFGAKYANRVQLRWLNLGRASVNAAPRTIAGNEAKAPLFRVCSYCGKLDMAAKSNSPEEHRFWCRNRKSSEEHVAEVALARVLNTQGVAIRLPASRVSGDDFALPSLTAALLLGLREVIGGSPDHIAAVPINEPADGGTAVSLLLHDKVPGGTGYLAEFAEPEKVWKLLHAAWDVVRNCECRNEERLACHRCLLPFAPPWQVEHVARVTAERLLRNILAGKDGAVDDDGEPSFSDWEVTDVPPVVVDVESHLEVKFRKALVDRLSKYGAHIKVTPGIRADKVEFRLPGAKHIWWLEPQVDIQGTRPDFVLSTADPNIPRIAIYTDGYQFHASPEHNRVADDAAKREGLRAVGVVPWAVTWEDIDTFAGTGAVPAPPWFTQKAAGLVQGGKTPLKPKLLAAIHQDAISQLWQWIQDPDVDGWADLSDAVPLLATGNAHRFKGAVLELAEYARASLDDPAAVPAAGPNPCWAYSDGPLRFAFGATSSAMASTAVVLLLDSREEAVAQAGYHDSWREWLRLSNLLAFKHVAPVIGAVTLAQPEIPAVVEPGALGKHLAPEWQELLELATSAEKDVLLTLSEMDGLPVPELGHESDDGIPLDISWPGHKVVLALNGDRHGELPAGWKRVPLDMTEIRVALGMKENG